MIEYLKTFNIQKKSRKNNTFIKTHNIGDDFKIGHNCLISKRVMISNNVSIGNFTYLNSSKYWITIESKVKIGSFCSIAPGVHIGAGNHDYNLVTTHPILFNKYYLKYLEKDIQRKDGLVDRDLETIIGNDVWIGFNAIIKRGIKIGNGAVIAAGSVVVKDVPDYAIVGGNPAKVIKYRTSEENINIIKQNENKMFWHWNKEKLLNNFDKLYSFDDYIDMFN